MKYTRVRIDAISYELAPVVVTSDELEDRLRPILDALHMPSGQLEMLTGITERRWWDNDFSVAEGAAAAGRKALPPKSKC
jgi:3-oxoacyl-[acyl-carrier-protein] synthase III